MTVIKIKYGTLPLFVNFDSEFYIEYFSQFLSVYGWKHEIMKNSCPIESIDETAETIKTEIMGMFWNWMTDGGEAA